MPSEPTPCPMVVSPLAATADELRANRAGKFTLRQRAMLDAYAGASQSWGAISLLVVVALALPGFIIGLVSSHSKEDVEGIVVGLLVLAAVALVSWVSTKRTNQALPRAGPFAVRGAAVKTTSYTEDGEAYAVSVCGVRFYVAPEVFEAFSEGCAYRVYYVPHSPAPMMLSFERDDER